MQAYASVLEYMGPDEAGNPERVTDEVLAYSDKNHVKLPEKKMKTQLDAVVEYLGAEARASGFVHKLQLWLPPLPPALYLKELSGYKDHLYRGGVWPSYDKWSLDVLAGLCDDPVSQAQIPLSLDFAENGHHAVCGVVVSGKSTFLQTVFYGLIQKYSPEHINLYGIDFSSRMLSAFENAPHVGGIVYEEDTEKIAKLFHMMEQMLEERKRLFKGGNYSQFVQANGITVPAVILAIDNYGSFREKTENRYDSEMIHLAHDGVGYGMFLLLSSGGFGTSEIQSKVGDSIKKTICLQMNDKFQYADALRETRVNVLPEDNIKGRGLAVVGGKILEFQTALAFAAENDYERIEEINRECTQMRAQWKGKAAKHIPVIPEKPIWSEYVQMDEVKEMMADDRRLPVGYDKESAGIYGIDLSRFYCYIISGRSRTGKTNLLKLLIHAAAAKGGRLCVIEHSTEELAAAAQKEGALYIRSQQEQADFFQSILEPFKKRNQLKRNLIKEGKEDSIYEAMKDEEKYFIFIADIAEFVRSIMKPEDGVLNIRAFIENVTEKGSGHNVYFFACCNPDTAASAVGARIYENMMGYHTGIHLGGNVTNIRYFDFSNIPYMEQGKVRRPGEGMLPLGNNEEIRDIVIPQVRGE